MTFKEFAHILKPIIGGEDTTSEFTRKLFDNILTEKGKILVEQKGDDVFKSYFNGRAGISKISQDVFLYVEKNEFSHYLDEIGETDSIAEELCSTFSQYIDDINIQNATEKIADLFRSILLEAAKSKIKSTPKSAKSTKKSNNDDFTKIFTKEVTQAYTESVEPFVQTIDCITTETDSNSNKESKTEYVEAEVVDDATKENEDKSHTTIIENQTVIEHDESKTFNIKDSNVTFNL